MPQMFALMISRKTTLKVLLVLHVLYILKTSTAIRMVNSQIGGAADHGLRAMLR